MKHGMLAVSEQGVRDIENWLGEQLDLVTTTWTAGQWGTLGLTWTDEPTDAALQRVFGETDRQLATHFKFGGEAGSRGNFAPAANGELDDRYRQTAREFVSVGMGDTIIRPEAEFNLEWSENYPDDPANYAEGYARMVREMLSVDGANFAFTYSPAQRRGGLEAECWPVDAPSWPSGVDEPVITPTIYDGGYFGYEDGGDTSPDRQTAMTAWQEEHYANKIEDWEAFAAERNTKVGGSFEWGCQGVGTPFPKASGGDNPYFIETFLNYGRDNDWEYQTYWNSGHHTILPRDGAGLQQASDQFKQTVGNRLGDSDPPDRSYGDYKTLDEGTDSWHGPLNDNFEAIGADVEDLDARIRQLEN